MPDNDQPSSSASPRPRATVVIGDYELGAQIGRGSFATVYRGINKRTNTLVAIKSVVRSSLTRRLLENLETEINILRTVKHESIVELIDCLKSRNHIHLVMEFCSLGDLAGYMRRRKEHPALRNEYGGLNMDIVRSFVSQLGSAMQFLRSRDVIHRDIKTQNILLQPSVDPYLLGESEARGELPWIKVADFGFARNLPSTALAETLCGSPLYMAPEILHYEPYDAKADLWSIGAVVYEMMTGRPPFHASNHVELARVIERTNDNIVFPDEKNRIESDTRLGLDPLLKDLVRRLLKMSPAARMPFVDFFAHPVLQWKADGELVARLHAAEAAAARAAADHAFGPSPQALADADLAHENGKDITAAMRSMHTGSNHAEERLPRNSAALYSQPSTQRHYPPQRPHLNDSLGQSHHRQPGLTDEALAEREYVVIEKRAVEMNVLADELNSSPRTPAVFYPPRANAFQQANVARQMTALARAVHDAVSPQHHITTETANGPLSRNGRRGVFNPLDPVLADTFESRVALGTAQEEPTIRRMEGLAYKAFAMSYLADIKWRLLPVAVSKKPPIADVLADPANGFLGPSDVSIEEAFVLYLRALSLLHRAMLEASHYWGSIHGNSTVSLTNRSTSTSSGSGSLAVTVSAAFNGAVQWVRDKFNECLERAEALKQLANGGELDHVAQVSVVQVLYEQALALSKVAAQRELKWIDPLDCDRAYQLAIWMLSAILESSVTELPLLSDDLHAAAAPAGRRDLGHEEDVLGLEDRTIVEQFIASIVKRRETLQRRLMQLDNAVV